MIWGKYTWIFFHSLAEKIKDDKFQEYKHVIFNIIFSLCSCLPCPTCKEHAMETLKKKNIFAVRSKEELKMFIYQFHNTVSHRKGMHTPDIQILEQYEYGNLRRIVQIFRQHFSTNIPGLMTQQLKRRSILNTCMNTLNKHWHIFNP
jgi:hypothetical protein